MRQVIGGASSSFGAAVVRDSFRSPPRAALPGLRVGAPGRLARQFASLPHVLTADDRKQALGDLDRDVLAESTHRTNEARLRTVASALALWGVPMWPPTPPHVLEGPSGHFEDGAL